MRNYITSAFVLLFIAQGLLAQKSQVDSIADELRQRCSGITYEDQPQNIKDTFAFFVTRYKNKDFEGAYPFWKSIVSLAPDIQPSVLQGGVEIMQARYKGTDDPALKTKIADTILALSESMSTCVGKGSNSYIEYRVYQWYTYRSTAKSKLNDLFEQYYREKGSEMNSQWFLVWLTTAMAVDKKSGTGGDPVWEVYDIIDQLCRDKESLAQTNEKALGYMKQYKYLDSTQLVKRSAIMYSESPEDYTVMRKCARFLQLSNATDSKLFKEIAIKIADNELALHSDSMASLQYAFNLYKQADHTNGIRIAAEKMFELDPNSMEIAMYLAQFKASSGKVKEAVELYNKAIQQGGDRASINYTIAQLYQSSGNFSQARSYAEKALKARPGWAEPHILIGRLYASSGSQCGEGTGWESQVVVWAAIDEWLKVGDNAEAQKLIKQYEKFLPTSQEIFMKDDVSNGGKYFVPCWIKREATVRPRP